MKQFNCILAAAIAFSVVEAHMEMINPPPRNSKHNSLYRGTPDYDMVRPLNMDGSDFPCKGYPAGPNVATYKSGETINVQLSGSATHGGGHCQFSISPDGVNFIAISTIIRDCLTGTGLTIPVKIPDNFPNCDNCVFAWSWVNALGNRELYMNCADVKIENPSSTNTVYEGSKMVVANLPGYPGIAEWPPATDDGRSLYLNAPIITVDFRTGSVQDTGKKSDIPASEEIKPADIDNGVTDDNDGVPSAESDTVLKANVFDPNADPAPISAERDQSENENLETDENNDEPEIVDEQENNDEPEIVDEEEDTETRQQAIEVENALEPIDELESDDPNDTECSDQQSKCTSDRRMMKCQGNIFKEYECPEGSRCIDDNKRAFCVTDEEKCWTL